MAVQHFENEFLTVNVTDEPGCVLKLDVVVTPKTIAEAHKQALSSVRKEVSLPGFRKGRVPEGLLHTHFAKAIEQEWKDNTLNLAFQKSLELTKKNPIRASSDKIKSKLKSFKGHNEPAEIFFEYEAFPVVPELELEQLGVQMPERKQVTEEDVNEIIESSRHSLAEWEAITDRPAEKGDFIRLDMIQMNDEETPVFENRRLVIVEKKMAPWLMDMVVGLKTGESREGSSIPEQSLDTANVDKELKAFFKPIPYRVTLVALEKPILPALDDEFAKRLGATDEAEMRTTIKKQLTAQREQEHRTAVIEALENALCDKHEFDLPFSLVSKDTASFENSKAQILRTQGNLSEDEVAGHKALIRELAEKESKKRLVLYYLLNEFNTKHHVQVSRDDLNQKLSQLLSHIPQEMVPQVVKSLNDEFYAAILSETVIEKGLDYITSKILAA